MAVEDAQLKRLVTIGGDAERKRGQIPFLPIAGVALMLLTALGGVAAADSQVDRHYRKAKKAYLAQRYLEAIKHSEIATQLDPKHWKAWALDGNARYAIHDKKGALNAYERALRWDPGNEELAAWVEKVRGESSVTEAAEWQTGQEERRRELHGDYLRPKPDRAFKKVLLIFPIFGPGGFVAAGQYETLTSPKGSLTFAGHYGKVKPFTMFGAGVGFRFYLDQAPKGGYLGPKVAFSLVDVHEGSFSGFSVGVVTGVQFITNKGFAVNTEIGLVFARIAREDGTALAVLGLSGGLAVGVAW